MQRRKWAFFFSDTNYKTFVQHFPKQLDIKDGKVVTVKENGTYPAHAKSIEKNI